MLKIHKKQTSDSVRPLVFVNRPINNPKNDIVGFLPQVNTICEAITNGSTMIGVVADYGAGKSSMTALLSQTVKEKPYKYPTPIKINMWDCLQSQRATEEKAHSAEREVTELTKSFLYQLASGKDKKYRFSSYINKRLSKNYGTISLSAFSRKFWVCFIIASLFYTIYAVCSNKGAIFSRVFEPGELLDTLNLCRTFSPLFLVISILFLVWGIIDTTIVFSHWKMQSVREAEVNDVFDVYARIITNIKPFRKKKKQLIIVEDLDRVVEKSVIIGFLKELYRFQNTMQNNADRFVFIVSLKPETMLKSEIPELNDDDNVYSKLFDIIIPLKPIHYDDYDALFLELFKKNPKEKERLEKIIGETISDDVLPSSFFWIKKGENLTLRSLKDRLNHAIMIMTTCLRQDYKVKTAITFEACAAVAYLESQYPSDYYKLIQKESDFAKLMSDSVEIINSNTAEQAVTELKNKCNELFNEYDLSDGFVDDLCTLIYNGVFNYDFRMYFYTYPTGSHIKTTEERALCDMLLMPSKFTEYKDLDRIVTAVYNDGDGNIVTRTIQELDEYPEVILMNETLLRVACETNWSQTALAVNKHIIEPMALDDLAIKFWTRVHNIQFHDKGHFVNSLVQFLISSFSSPADTILSRTYIIKAYGKDILEYKDIFLKSSSTDIPQITAEEIRLIDSVDVSIELIDIDNLTTDNFDYILELLCSEKLCESSFEKALAVMKRYALLTLSTFNNAMLRFMNINHHADDELFSKICKGCDKNALLEYLNSFAPEEISDKYLETIEDLGFESGLSEGILQILASKGNYRCILLSASSSNDFVFIDEQLESVDGILNDCRWIQENYSDHILKIRYHLCVEKNDSRYLSLFNTPFPLITKDEFISLANTSDAISCTNIDEIDESNYSEVFCFIYERFYSCEETVQLMQHLFDPEHYSGDTQQALFSDMVTDFDFKAVGVPALEIEDRETVYSLVEHGFDDADVFLEDRLRKMGTLIPSVEKELSDDDCYPELVCELDEFTPYTLEWMKDHYISVPASTKLSTALKENHDFENFITSSVLREKNMIIDESIPRDSYLNVYLDVPEMYSIMSNHWDFLEGLQNQASLKKLSESSRYSELIPPIYKVPQHHEFFRFILDGAFTDDFKTDYLDNMGKFSSNADSKAFQILICKQKNMELMGDKDRYWRIWNNFWDKSHRGVFTRKWRERWGNEIDLS